MGNHVKEFHLLNMDIYMILKKFYFLLLFQRNNFGLNLFFQYLLFCPEEEILEHNLLISLFYYYQSYSYKFLYNHLLLRKN
jgi:hypothetical protein